MKSENQRILYVGTIRRLDSQVASRTAKSPLAGVIESWACHHFSRGESSDSSGDLAATDPLPPPTIDNTFLPLEGVPASPGPGLRTVSGASRSRGAFYAPRAILYHGRRTFPSEENPACPRDRGVHPSPPGASKPGAGPDGLRVGQ